MYNKNKVKKKKWYEKEKFEFIVLGIIRLGNLKNGKEKEKEKKKIEFWNIISSNGIGE